MADLPKIIFSSSEETASDTDSSHNILKDYNTPDSPVFQPRKKFIISSEDEAQESTQNGSKDSQSFLPQRLQELSSSVQDQIIFIKVKQEIILKSIETGSDFPASKKLYEDLKIMLANVNKTLSMSKSQLKELHYSQVKSTIQLSSSQMSTVNNQSTVISSAQCVLNQQKMLLKLFKIHKLIAEKLFHKVRIGDHRSDCLSSNHADINVTSNDSVTFESQPTQDLVRAPVDKSNNTKDKFLFGPGKADEVCTSLNQKDAIVPNYQSDNILVSLLNEGVVNAGDNVLSINYKGEIFFAGLTKDGSIYSNSKVFSTVEEWIYFVRGVRFSKQTVSKMVKYLGKPLTSLMLSKSKFKQNFSESESRSNRHTAKEIFTDNGLKNQSEHQPIVFSKAKGLASLEPQVPFERDALVNESHTVNVPEKSLSNVLTTLPDDRIMLNCSHEDENNFIQNIRNIRLFDEDEFIKSSDFLPDDFWNETVFEFRINKEFMMQIDFY